MEVTRKMLQEMPAAFDFVTTLPKTLLITNGEVNRMVKQEFPEAVDRTNNKEGWQKSNKAAFFIIWKQRILSWYKPKHGVRKLSHLSYSSQLKSSTANGDVFSTYIACGACLTLPTACCARRRRQPP